MSASSIQARSFGSLVVLSKAVNLAVERRCKFSQMVVVFPSHNAVFGGFEVVYCPSVEGVNEDNDSDEEQLVMLKGVTKSSMKANRVFIFCNRVVGEMFKLFFIKAILLCKVNYEHYT